MSLFVVLLLALLPATALGASCPKAPDHKCVDATYECCDSNFQNNLNISAACGVGSIWNFPICIRNQLGAIWQQGTHGVLEVCDAYSQFRSCLGKSLHDCTNDGYYIRQGLLGVFQAQQVQTLFTELNYICGAGMDIFLNNDVCMSKVFKQNGTDIKACRKQFNDNIKANPSNACQFEETLKECVAAPFQSCGMEAMFYMCENERVILNTWLPMCSKACSFQQKLSNHQNLEVKNAPKEQ
ncbi:hypothetical protein L596_003520 [Steinernema carpocapsae]|uniref:Uncharacterized protein n=1 Tax=Steinernema carpocapsae TaxID=34508 RepID=A0A4U8UUG1_STECR|nr:hypothetical protein L596_003520 [Steinernema carpocapsae]